jgi:hypothetical protein
VTPIDFCLNPSRGNESWAETKLGLFIEILCEISDRIFTQPAEVSYIKSCLSGKTYFNDSEIYLNIMRYAKKKLHIEELLAKYN